MLRTLEHVAVQFAGIQALRNFRDVAEFRSIVYASPETIDALQKAIDLQEAAPLHYMLGCSLQAQGKIADALCRYVDAARDNVEKFIKGE